MGLTYVIKICNVVHNDKDLNLIFLVLQSDSFCSVHEKTLGFHQKGLGVDQALNIKDQYGICV